MRGASEEAKPYELRLCVNRSGMVFWWPIRLPAEDGKSNLWWDTARQVADLAKTHWMRCFADRAANMYASTRATIEMPPPAWPDKSVRDLLALGFTGQLIDSPDCHVLKVLRGEV